MILIDRMKAFEVFLFEDSFMEILDCNLCLTFPLKPFHLLINSSIVTYFLVLLLLNDLVLMFWIYKKNKNKFDSNYLSVGTLRAWRKT